MAGSSGVTIIAAADGSALGNPGPAGWAWTIDDDTWRCGGWTRGTNNQGELTAVLDLLRQTAHVDDDLLVYCDSQYVINSITSWMPGWKRKGWKKKDGKPVLNVEVMKALDEAMRGRRVRFEWVRGHAGHPLNEAADKLANGAATAMSKGRTPEAGPGFPGARAVGAGDDPAAPPSADGRAAVRAAAPAEETPDLFSTSVEDPAGTAAPARDDVSDVMALERQLLDPDVRSDRRRVTRLLDAGWKEIGASGALYTRREVPGLPAPEAPGEIEVLEHRRLGDDLLLVLWRARGAAGSTLRSSLWQRTATGWSQLFQQGTPER